jgi:CHAT domain-containing protein/tetratricopeptide (TPR) repeat protein
MKATELGSLLLKGEDYVRSYAATATSAQLSEIFEAMWSEIRAANLTSGQPRGSASSEKVSLARLAVSLANSSVDPLLQADSHRMMAYTLNANEEYEDSLIHYRHALQIFDAAGRVEVAARTRLGFVAALKAIGRYTEAIEVAECARRSLVAIKDMQGLARLYANLANVYHRLDDSARALDYHEKARAIFRRQKDKRAMAQCSINMGNCLSSLDRFEESERSYRQVERISKEPGMSELRAPARYNLAYLFFQRGRYSDALQAFGTLRRQFERQQSLLYCGLCDMDMAEIYLHLNMPRDAAPLAGRAAETFRRLGMRYEQAKSTACLGVASAQRHDLKKALSILDQAQVMFQEEQNQYWLALVDLYRAELFFAMNRLSEAQSLASAALQRFTVLDSPSRRVAALILLARLGVSCGQYDEARIRAEKALELAREYKIQPLMFPSLVIHAELFEHAGEPGKAADFYEQAAAELETGLNALRHDDLKVAFFEGKPTIYEALARIVLNSNGDPEQVLERAYSWCERAKSRSLIDLLSQHVHGIRAPAEDPLLPQVEKLHEELNNYYHRTLPALRVPSANERDNIQRKESDLARLLREMSDKNAEYVSLQKVSIASLEQVQQCLPSDSTLVEYFKIRDEVVAFVIDRRKAKIVRGLCSHDHVQHLEECLRFQLERPLTGPSYVRAHESLLAVSAKHYLGELHAALFEPIQKIIETTRLVIVPHGVLHYLPFHAFHDGTQPLIDSYAISYAPSASVFRYCVQKPDVLDCSPLIIGVPDRDAPQIGEETSALHRLLPQARLLEGRRASWQRFKREVGRADFVHVATHAVFREDNPMFSAFKLAGRWVTVQDLYGLRCEANLLTLSGCSSGMHQVAGADELLGLVRGLLYAGARSLLLSLWPVSDESTSQLMKAFYSCWNAGMSKTAALQRACQEVRANFPHPFFWAPFVLIGKP